MHILEGKLLVGDLSFEIEKESGLTVTNIHTGDVTMWLNEKGLEALANWLMLAVKVQ